MEEKTILQLMFIALVVLLTLLYTIPLERKRKRLLNFYWTRACSGKDWVANFPNYSKESIRDFLSIFVDSFCFNPKKRLKFKPNDKVMDIYHALYPDKYMADALELEDFADRLKKKYGVDLYSVTNNNITLGEIFEMTIKASQQKNRGDRE